MEPTAPIACPVPHAPGPVPGVERLVADSAMQRQAAWFRILAGQVAAAGGLWLCFVTSSWLLRITGAISILFAMLWMRAQLRVLRSAREHVDYLELGPHHLALVEGGVARSIVLTSIRSVELDHDRLVVVLQLDDGTTLSLEPRYPGVGLRELGERVLQAVETARATP
jgi:hypothetical protein